MADEQPEHEWFRVAETEPGTWLMRDRVTGIEGYAPEETALNFPMWPEDPAEPEEGE